MAVNEKTTRKKSKATSIQPEKPATNAARCPSLLTGDLPEWELGLVCKGNDLGSEVRSNAGYYYVRIRLLKVLRKYFVRVEALSATDF